VLKISQIDPLQAPCLWLVCANLGALYIYHLHQSAYCHKFNNMYIIHFLCIIFILEWEKIFYFWEGNVWIKCERNVNKMWTKLTRCQNKKIVKNSTISTPLEILIYYYGAVKNLTIQACGWKACRCLFSPVFSKWLYFQ